tara:strand:+ start:117 stop:326 length:210 start_codon:yes stop_codon:yes gene_type:complete
MLKFLIKIALVILFTTTPSYAYLGPGIAGGVLVATLGILVAIIAAIFGLFWFPIKRLIQKIKKKKKKID